MDKEFKDRYKVKQKGEVIDIDQAREDKDFEELLYKSSTVPIKRFSREQQAEIAKIKFTASAGTAREAKQQSEMKKAARRQKRAAQKRRRIGGIVLAAALTLGGIGVYSTTSENAKPTLSDLVEQEADVSKLGLSQRTMSKLAQYEMYFEDMGSLKDKTTLDVANELYNLNLNMIKEKIAMVTGESVEDLKIWLHFEKGDGSTLVTVETTKNDGREILYSGSSDSLSFLDGDDRLPKEIIDQATLLYELENLRDKISDKKISDQNAWKEAKGYYDKMDKFASKQLIQDKNGKISVLDYSEVEKIASKDVQHEDNER